MIYKRKPNNIFKELKLHSAAVSFECLYQFTCQNFFLLNEVLHHLNQKWSYVKLIICMISTWVLNYIYAQLVEFVNIYLKIFFFVNQPLQNVLLMRVMVSISIVNTLFYLEIRDDMACLVFEMWICLSCLKIHSTL